MPSLRSSPRPSQQRSPSASVRSPGSAHLALTPAALPRPSPGSGNQPAVSPGPAVSRPVERPSLCLWHASAAPRRAPPPPPNHSALGCVVLVRHVTPEAPYLALCQYRRA